MNKYVFLIHNFSSYFSLSAKKSMEKKLSPAITIEKFSTHLMEALKRRFTSSF